jgi:hypothetical protein
LPVNELALAEYMGEIERCGPLPEVHLRWFRFRAGGGSGHGGDLKAKLSEGYMVFVPLQPYRSQPRQTWQVIGNNFHGSLDHLLIV